MPNGLREERGWKLLDLGIVLGYDASLSMVLVSEGLMAFFIVQTVDDRGLRILPTLAPDWETVVAFTLKFLQQGGKDGELVQVELLPDVVEETKDVLAKIVGVPPDFPDDSKEEIEEALSFQLEYYWAMMDRKDHEVILKSSDVCEIDEGGMPVSVESVESVLERYGLAPHDEGEATRAQMLALIEQTLAA